VEKKIPGDRPPVERKKGEKREISNRHLLPLTVRAEDAV